jgi:hypothetical protein
MPEQATRLAPKGDTLRELFLKSGNLCAFPNCTNLLMNADGAFIGEVCHIEAAEKEGERFNDAMSNEDRRAFENLLLMCHEHHVVTNDVDKFPVSKMREMKEDHERRFSRPDRAILEKLTDWTTLEQPTNVKNLRRLNEVLAWDASDEELAHSIQALNEYIDVLRRVPIEVRSFLRATLSRAHRMRDTRAVKFRRDSILILASDLQSALRLRGDALDESVRLLEAYGLGDYDEFETDSGIQPGIRVRGLRTGELHWAELIAFCEKTSTPLEVFTDDLDFGRLDAPNVVIP